jgi:hypothetical protein
MTTAVRFQVAAPTQSAISMGCMPPSVNDATQATTACVRLRAARRLASLLALLLANVGLEAARHDIRDYGAVPDGRTLNTTAINRAVTVAAGEGGGTVVVPAGRFLTGTVYLQSGVTLQLDAGAVLLGSTELSDYPENPAPALDDSVPARRIRHIYPDNLEFGRHSLIYAAGQRDVAVTGAGRIDGQGSHPNLCKQELRKRGVPERDAYLKRPYGMCFVGCTGVKVSGLTLVDLAFWSQDYLNCDEVTVTGVTVDSRKNDANNDGIDIDGSRRVRIAGCRFNAGDDAICLKSSLRTCEDVRITDCVCSSLANGVKFGTASNGGFRNVTVSGLTMHDVNGAGLALEVVDGGLLEDITVSDVTMENVGAAFFLRLGDRGERWMRPEDHAVGVLRNVKLSRITATVYSPVDGRPLASSIMGLPGHPVSNVSLRDIRITNVRAHAPAEADIPLEGIGEHAGEYPEFSMFGPLPGHALFIRHAQGIEVSNLEIMCQGTDYRSAIACDRVENLTIAGLRTTVTPGARPVIALHDVTRATVGDVVVPPGTDVLLRAEGQSTAIVLEGKGLKNARTAVSLGDGLRADAVTVKPNGG